MERVSLKMKLYVKKNKPKGEILKKKRADIRRDAKKKSNLAG